MARIVMSPPNLSVLKKGKEKYDVFISYRRNPDQDVANSILWALKSKGYNVFFDHNSIVDGKFLNIITDAIKSSSVFLLLISDRSLERCSDPNDIMRLEIETALKHGKKIIPVVKEPNLPKFPELPDSIKELCDFNVSILHDNSFESDIDMIIKHRINNVPHGANFRNEDFYMNFGGSTLASNSVSVGKMISMIILAVALVVILIKLL